MAIVGMEWLVKKERKAKMTQVPILNSQSCARRALWPFLAMGVQEQELLERAGNMNSGLCILKARSTGYKKCVGMTWRMSLTHSFIHSLVHQIFISLNNISYTMSGAKVIKLNETTVPSRNSEMNGLERQFGRHFLGGAMASRYSKNCQEEQERERRRGVQGRTLLKAHFLHIRKM